MTARVASSLLLFVSACALSACGAAGPEAGAVPSPSATGAASAGPSDPTAARVAAPAVCEEIIARYGQVLRTASGRCTSDAECTRFGGVDPDDVCGGVTDAKTGRSLQAISEELDAARCPRLAYSCPAMQPRCDAGACR
jgi:hypothetical protein